MNLSSPSVFKVHFNDYLAQKEPGMFRAPESSEGNALTFPHAGRFTRAGMTASACMAERARGFTGVRDPAYRLLELKNRRKLCKSLAVMSSFYLEQKREKGEQERGWPSTLFW